MERPGVRYLSCWRTCEGIEFMKCDRRTCDNDDNVGEPVDLQPSAVEDCTNVNGTCG